MSEAPRSDNASFRYATPLEASVVVPSYNRPEHLVQCLAALVRQEGVEYEIIVVDDGSPQPLEKVCAAFGSRVTCIRQENAGPAAARNRGASHARGEFIAFTDDDCRPRPDWLANLRRAHRGRDDALVGGRVENGLPHDPYATASQDLSDELYDYFGAASGDVQFFTSNNLGVSREGFRQLAGFDETFPLAGGEDRDFGLRWRDMGRHMVYAPDAVIDHFHGMSLQEFWRQHATYGRGAFHLHGLQEARGAHGRKRAPLSFYVGLVLRPLRARGMRGLGHVPLMALMQLATLAGYARARAEAGAPAGTSGSAPCRRAISPAQPPSKT